MSPTDSSDRSMLASAWLFASHALRSNTSAKTKPAIRPSSREIIEHFNAQPVELYTHICIHTWYLRIFICLFVCLFLSPSYSSEVVPLNTETAALAHETSRHSTIGRPITTFQFQTNVDKNTGIRNSEKQYYAGKKTRLNLEKKGKKRHREQEIYIRVDLHMLGLQWLQRLHHFSRLRQRVLVFCH